MSSVFTPQEKSMGKATAPMYLAEDKWMDCRIETGLENKASFFFIPEITWELQLMKINHSNNLFSTVLKQSRFSDKQEKIA